MLTARITRGSFTVRSAITSPGSLLGRIIRLDIKITRSNYMSSTEGNFRLKDTDKLKVKDGKTYIIKIATTRELQWLC